MGLRRIIFLLLAVSVFAGGFKASAEDLGCDSKPEGTELTCAQIIQNALDAIDNQQLRLKAAFRAKKKACAGQKNRKVRRMTNFKARQVKSNSCIAALNTLAGTEIFQGLVQLGLAESRQRCPACAM